MKILSNPILDKKINSYNFLVEMSMNEYYSLVLECIKNNEFQRNKVKSSKSIYSLLKQDLISGCIIPPIVLSLSCSFKKNEELNNNEFLKELVSKNKNKLMILDGLQRTFTIQDIVEQAKLDPQVEPSLNNPIRVEIYLGLNREGVLYRMLTLNTGQTPMKLRHQVEIIYSSLMNENTDGYKLIKDTDNSKGKSIGEYKFSDAIDCFTSYMEGDYLQINRDKLLDTIKSFENISKLSVSQDLFDTLIRLYTAFTSFVDKGTVGSGVSLGTMFPALFVTIACGAISGFHSLVGSGTTAKQLNNERDARPIAYGGMLIESALAIISLCAVAYIWKDYAAGTTVGASLSVAAFPQCSASSSARVRRASPTPCSSWQFPHSALPLLTPLPVLPATCSRNSGSSPARISRL